MHPPLYENATSTMAQTEYLVHRYRDEPTILAWDLRDSGDADYQGGTIGGIQHHSQFERRTVVDWLIRTAAAIRTIDDQHIITAGWNADSVATHIAVDMISFQFWDDPEELPAYINNLDQQVDKPLLLIGIGYDSQTHNPSQQSSMLRNALNTAEQSIEWEQIVGWLVWTTFDFAPGSACDLVACPDGTEDPRHFFGLWDTNRNPKPAFNVIDVITQPPIIIPTYTPELSSDS
jgi:endo-1,4-beta-mannosidase